mmetsp:Transcript_3884/g.8766  ORF Transcript_3884/g.8766 Transcript_3884/m.8766 type:complete len:563 (-) Transcript_3884:704-2392(-)
MLIHAGGVAGEDAGSRLHESRSALALAHARAPCRRPRGGLPGHVGRGLGVCKGGPEGADEGALLHVVGHEGGEVGPEDAHQPLRVAAALAHEQGGAALGGRRLQAAAGAQRPELLRAEGLQGARAGGGGQTRVWRRQGPRGRARRQRVALARGRRGARGCRLRPGRLQRGGLRAGGLPRGGFQGHARGRLAAASGQARARRLLRQRGPRDRRAEALGRQRDVHGHERALLALRGVQRQSERGRGQSHFRQEEPLRRPASEWQVRRGHGGPADAAQPGRRHEPRRAGLQGWGHGWAAHPGGRDQQGSQTAGAEGDGHRGVHGAGRGRVRSTDRGLGRRGRPIGLPRHGLPWGGHGPRPVRWRGHRGLQPRAEVSLLPRLAQRGGSADDVGGPPAALGASPGAEGRFQGRDQVGAPWALVGPGLPLAGARTTVACLWRGVNGGAALRVGLGGRAAGHTGLRDHTGHRAWRSSLQWPPPVKDQQGAPGGVRPDEEHGGGHVDRDRAHAGGWARLHAAGALRPDLAEVHGRAQESQVRVPAYLQPEDQGPLALEHGAPGVAELPVP